MRINPQRFDFGRETDSIPIFIQVDYYGLSDGEMPRFMGALGCQHYARLSTPKPLCVSQSSRQSYPDILVEKYLSHKRTTYLFFFKFQLCIQPINPPETRVGPHEEWCSFGEMAIAMILCVKWHALVRELVVIY